LTDNIGMHKIKNGDGTQSQKELRPES